MQKTRRSQFSSAPTQKAIELREWDYNVFKLLHPELGYQELPSNWIVALLGGYYKDKLERYVDSRATLTYIATTELYAMNSYTGQAIEAVSTE